LRTRPTKIYQACKAPYSTNPTHLIQFAYLKEMGELNISIIFVMQMNLIIFIDAC
jgi:hypothetical protein